MHFFQLQASLIIQKHTGECVFISALTADLPKHNYADHVCDPARRNSRSNTDRYFTFIFTATWIAAVANACQTKKLAKGEMTRVLFSAKIPHRPPTCSLLSLPSSLDCSALLLTAFSAQDSTTKCLTIPQIFVLCYKCSVLGQITPELDQFVRENKER